MVFLSFSYQKYLNKSIIIFMSFFSKVLQNYHVEISANVSYHYQSCTRHTIDTVELLLGRHCSPLYLSFYSDTLPP